MTPVVNLHQVLQITLVVTGCTFIARAEPAPNYRKNGHVEEMTRASLHQTQHVQCLQSTCIAFTEPLCNTILISEFVHFHNRAQLFLRTNWIDKELPVPAGQCIFRRCESHRERGTLYSLTVSWFPDRSWQVPHSAPPVYPITGQAPGHVIQQCPILEECLLRACSVA